MAQSFYFFILFIVYTGSAKTHYFPEARYFCKKESRDLNALMV